MDFERFTTDERPLLSVTEGYHLWALNYEATVVNELDITLLGRIDGGFWKGIRRVADLGCGTGRMGEWLRQRGIEQVSGVDVTTSMLDQARRGGNYTTLLQEDLLRTSLPSDEFDLVISSLVVGHLESLENFYAEATRLLCTPGWLIVIGYHPHFLLSGVPTGFTTPAGEKYRIRNYIHLFSDHFRIGAGHEMVLSRLDESVVEEGWSRDSATWSKFPGHPASFLMLWQKPSSG